MTKIQLSSRLSVFTLMVFLTSICLAQDPNIDANPATKQYKHALTFSPFYAVVNGIRIDYERKINNRNEWLVFAPQFYSDLNGYGSYYAFDYAEYETMNGFGLNMYFKKIAYQSKKKNKSTGLSRSSFYIQVGPTFQRYSLKNTQETTEQFTENGTAYFEVNPKTVKKPISRYGANINIGWQVTFGWLIIDMYGGVGVKYSYGKKGELIRPQYTDITSMDYSGILVDGGIKLGMFF